MARFLILLSVVMLTLAPWRGFGEANPLPDLLTTSLQIDDSPTCKEHYAAFQEKLAHPLTLDKMLAQIKAKNPDLIALGETHFASSSDAYPAILESLKAAMPSTNCLYLEFSPAFSLDVKALMLGRTDLIRDNRTYEYRNIIYAAMKNGVRVLLPDSEQRTEVAPIQTPFGALYPGWMWGDSAEGMNTRNIALANTIAKSLHDGTCTKGLLIVGKGHLTVTNRKTTNLATLLRANSVKVTSVDVISTGLSGFAPNTYLDDSFFWRACAKQPDPPALVVGFKNDGLMQNQPLSEYYGGRAADLDYTLVTPARPFSWH